MLSALTSSSSLKSVDQPGAMGSPVSEKPSTVSDAHFNESGQNTSHDEASENKTAPTLPGFTQPISATAPVPLVRCSIITHTSPPRHVLRPINNTVVQVLEGARKPAAEQKPSSPAERLVIGPHSLFEKCGNSQFLAAVERTAPRHRHIINRLTETQRRRELVKAPTRASSRLKARADGAGAGKSQNAKMIILIPPLKRKRSDTDVGKEYVPAPPVRRSPRVPPLREFRPRLGGHAVVGEKR